MILFYVLSTGRNANAILAGLRLIFGTLLKWTWMDCRHFTLLVWLLAKSFALSWLYRVARIHFFPMSSLHHFWLPNIGTVSNEINTFTIQACFPFDLEKVPFMASKSFGGEETNQYSNWHPIWVWISFDLEKIDAPHSRKNNLCKKFFKASVMKQILNIGIHNLSLLSIWQRESTPHSREKL